jgi:hypothetical protein
MPDLKQLSDQTAEALLTAIKTAAEKASDYTRLLQLSQSYAMVESARSGEAPQAPISAV